MTATTTQTFWENVDSSGGADSCWPWIGDLTGKGYGRAYVSDLRKSVTASRFALELVAGIPAPDGKFALHSCDNPPCCNPRHLRFGTKRENSADMVERGRSPRQRNEKSGKAKLSDVQVAEIRANYEAGESSTSLAARYGVSAWHITQIARVSRRPIEGATQGAAETPWAERRRVSAEATEARWAEARRLYESGLTLEQVADRVGGDGTQVLRQLRKRGVVMRSPSSYRKFADPEDVRALHSRGVRAAVIARQLGVGRGQVDAIFAQLGLPPFPSGRTSRAKSVQAGPLPANANPAQVPVWTRHSDEPVFLTPEGGEGGWVTYEEAGT